MATWTVNYYGASGSTTDANDSWSSDYAGTGTVTSWFYIWTADSTDSITSDTYAYPGNCYIYEPVPENETEAQRQARLQREEEYHRQQEELRQEQEAAVKRAEELLKEYIGVEAFGQLHEVGYIELDSQGYRGRKYRVPASHMAYIEVLDEEGKVIDTLCVHPAIECPPPDHILTRVVMLQNDEESLLAAANHWGPRDRSYY